MAKTNLNEDKIALLTGCFIFLLAALNLAHLDVLGWVVSTNMWTSMDKAFSATTGAYKMCIGDRDSHGEPLGLRARRVAGVSRAADVPSVLAGLPPYPRGRGVA